VAAEIEIKARTGDYLVCKARLDALAGTGAPFVKDDAYWISQGYGAGRFPSGLRVRRLKKDGKQKVLVTWKNKERRDGIEINDEKEFAVGGSNNEDAETFEELLSALGFEKRAVKHKEGWVWSASGENVVPGESEMTIELCGVSGYALDKKTEAKDLPHAVTKDIGWFLELEILAPDAEPETVRAAREALFSMLKEAGLDENAVETRYYTEILRGGQQAGSYYGNE
jgi:adenylate cyclase class 2